MTRALTGKQRRHLRGLAHDQKALVQIGHAGLTEPVTAAIDAALETHELVKVKVLGEAPESAEELTARLEAATQSQVAQLIGRTLVLYRARKKDPRIVLPKASKRARKSEGGA